ncbi:MAG: tetratricopeptide repeat protein [Rhodocyclaceae bacterium]|jgi:predicted negative regulator of RcsB-dependent stress response|nr:tetratricopeptide repeat protein [Rhodocyclaceae bacterium]MBK6553569.1 tetratricopeptide repeat protein [Rhodocyclaceae bacterium]MBK6675419.1 tetratricopeptide repeat protein [Rhodocyclaceae bacterium]MBK7813805.1 tetratricopeptide repeat protein [Rhodocyclaceae bacterium]MBK9311154.1 tetratricopeptide repeat protein [Rhodocyclaceae bacterium]
MATYDLEEQEQLDSLKTWWKMHGNLVTTVVTVAALAVLAWQGWGWWQRTQATQASALFGGVQSAVAQNDAKRAREMAGELIDKFSGTAHAALAALLSAKAQIEGGDIKSARMQLTWAADHAKDDGIRDLARLRLATVMLDDKAYDEALARIAAEPAPSLAPRFNDLRGDILMAQGKNTEAKAAYEAALVKLDALIKEGGAEARARGAYRETLQIKIDALGGAVAAGEAK